MSFYNNFFYFSSRLDPCIAMSLGAPEAAIITDPHFWGKEIVLGKDDNFVICIHRRVRMAGKDEN